MPNNPIVLDASVAIKWFFEEPGSDKASALQTVLHRQTIKVIVPQLFFFEIANVIKTKPKSTRSELNTAIKILFELPFITNPIDVNTLTKTAFYAHKYNLSIYDAAYLALAKINQAILVSADNKMVKRVKLPFVKLLNSYAAASRD